MKTVMQLLSLLLCFEFIVAPVQGSLLIDSAMAEDQKSCPAGQQYESSVNRCLTKYEVLKVNEATQSCGTDRGCYEDNAKRALGDAGMSTSGKVTSGLETAVNAAAVAIPLVIVTTVLLEKRASKAGSGFQCKPASLMLMYGAAAALAVGEIYGTINHASRLKKIKQKWQDSVVPNEASGTDKKRTEATEAQSQAFEFLAQNEEQVGKTAKTKKGFYIAAAGLFAAGAGMATVEMIQLNAATKQLPISKKSLEAAKLAATTDTTGTAAAKIPKLELEVHKHSETIARLSCFQAKDKDGNNIQAGGKNETELADEAKKTAADKITAAEVEKADKQAYADAEKLLGEKGTPAQQAAYQEKLKKAQEAELEQANELIRKREAEEAAKQLQYNLNKRKNRGVSLPKKDIDKMKRVAAYNLSTAKDGDQFLNLMQEYESIEFENYSQARYTEFDKNLKEVTFSPILAKMMAEVLIPQAHAEGSGGILALAGTLGGPLLGNLQGITKFFKFNNGKPMSAGEMNDISAKSGNFVLRAIGKPVTRLAINGVLGGWMTYMMINMNKQQHLAQDRAKKLRSMKEEFNSANGLLYCTEEQRNDTTKPKCYCYTSDNKVNPSRASSDVCKNTLASLKDSEPDNDQEKVCVTTGMSMDSTCACRKTNTCLKTTAGFTSMGFSPATFRMISANAGPANDLFNGNASAAGIADSAGINAARTQAAAANAIAGDKVAVREAKNAADAFTKGLLATTSGLSMGSSAGSSPLPTTPAGAAAALDKEIKEHSDDIDVTSSGKSNSASANLNSTEEVPEFGMSSGDAAAQEIEIAEVMGKEVDFGSNDINKTKDTNLFEVLSNRYKRSGMKRLFEDGSSAPADAPSKTDISN